VSDTAGIAARMLALDALLLWHREGAFLARTVHQLAEDQRRYPLEEGDRGLAQELALGVCRYHELLEASVLRFCQKKPSREVLVLLQLGAYQLFMLSRIPDHAVVHTMVALARKRQSKQVGGFVNSILRKLQQEGLVSAPGNKARDLAIRYSHPQWLVKKWLRELGPDHTRARLQCALEEPQQWIRINLSRIQPQEFLQLEENPAQWLETSAQPLFGRYFAVRHLAPLLKSQAFSDGLFSVQDPASWKVCELLDVQKGQRVLDYCAAPGGKTAALLESVHGDVEMWACDINADRLAQVEDVRQRLGFDRLQLCLLGGAGPLPEPESFDRVLVDAPCSNLGVLARRPELKARLRPESLQEHAHIQLDVLSKAAELVKPQGRLVYSTCSPEPEETNEVVEAFLASHTDFQRQDEFRIVPRYSPQNDEPELDGFYGIALQRVLMLCLCFVLALAGGVSAAMPESELNLDSQAKAEISSHKSSETFSVLYMQAGAWVPLGSLSAVLDQTVMSGLVLTLPYYGHWKMLASAEYASVFAPENQLDLHVMRGRAGLDHRYFGFGLNLCFVRAQDQQAAEGYLLADNESDYGFWLALHSPDWQWKNWLFRIGGSWDVLWTQPRSSQFWSAGLSVGYAFPW